MPEMGSIDKNEYFKGAGAPFEIIITNISLLRLMSFLNVLAAQIRHLTV